MSATCINGQPRKTLATQLDRLDGILDALSDGLNEAVAMVVERAVTQAVEKAVAQVLADPVLRERLTTAAPAPVKRGESPIRRVWNGIAGWVQACWQGMVTFGKQSWMRTREIACSSMECGKGALNWLASSTHSLIYATWLTMAILMVLAVRFRRPLLIATSVGLCVGALCHMAGPMVATGVSGLVSALLALSGLAMQQGAMNPVSASFAED